MNAPRGPAVPVLDEDGLLRFGDRWVAIPDAQLGVVGLLLARPMKVVRYDEIVEQYGRSGGNPTWSAVRSMLVRLGARFRAVGLELVAVRSRGVRLALPSTR